MFITPCDLGLSPPEVALRLAGLPGVAWLDGGLTHGQEGRYSFVGACPVAIAERCFGDTQALSVLDELYVEARGAEREQDTAWSKRAGPRASKTWFAHEDGPKADEVPAWVGYIAYDAAWSGRRETRLARHSKLPCASFARYDALFVFDHETGLSFLAGDDRIACEHLWDRLRSRAPIDEKCLAYQVGEVHAGGADRHCARVQAALERIRAGDVYEVNLARPFRAPFRGSGLGLFLRMRELSPVPFGFFLEASEHAVLGRSMERFLRFRKRDGALWTSPIKGTLARGGDLAREAETLRADPKEHAEHAMVVDLMRNDLSRVAQPGSVHIRELMRVSPFAGLSHLVSTIEARALPELTLSQILAGTFPPGSVTGAPKESAVRIIEELEEAPRGVYTGALGFVDRTGGCSFSVAIRTAVVHEGEVEYFAGGGIVIDSEPERETRETELKAQVFLRALEGGRQI